MDGKKIFLLILLCGWFTNTGIFALASQAPLAEQSGCVREHDGVVYIYPKDNSAIGLCLGGAMVIAGVALAIYGKIKRYKLECKKDDFLDDADPKDVELLCKKIDKEIESYEGYYWGGGIVGLIGAIVYLLAMHQKNNNQRPIVTLNGRGISVNGKQLGWQDLAEVRERIMSRRVEKINHCQVHDARYQPVMSVDVPTTEMVNEPYVELVAQRRPGDFEITARERNIMLPEADLPVSGGEFARIISDYRDAHHA